MANESSIYIFFAILIFVCTFTAITQILYYMNIIGKWKPVKLNVMVSRGDEEYRTKELTKDEFLAHYETLSEEEQENLSDYKKMYETIFKFDENGDINMMMYVAPEIVEQAKAEGLEIDEDGYTVIEQSKWKEQNGEFFYDSGVKGGMCGDDGEVVQCDPFVKIAEREDGTLVYSSMFILGRL